MPGNLLLAIFKTVVENEPEMDDRGVKKSWDYLAYKAHPWDHAEFCRTIDSWMHLDLFKGFQILGIVYILK